MCWLVGSYFIPLTLWDVTGPYSNYFLMLFKVCSTMFQNVYITGFPTIYWLVPINFWWIPIFLSCVPTIFGRFPEFVGLFVLISNRKIPINYGNEPKIYGIRPKNRGNAPKNHGNWPINRGNPVFNIAQSREHNLDSVALFFECQSANVQTWLGSGRDREKTPHI